MNTSSQQKAESVNKKCQLLISLGFDIAHQDSSVFFSGVEFDFSATNCDVKDILYTALEIMYSKGKAEGRKELQQSIRSLLTEY